MHSPIKSLATISLVAVLILSACSSEPNGPGSSGNKILPATTKGLLMLDCWKDTATPVDAKTAKTSMTFDLSAEPAKGVYVDLGCNDSSETYGPGVSSYNPDHTLIAAWRDGQDKSRHVGFIAAATGKFTDLSTRLKLNANGEFTDEGSGADDFAGPISDTAVGFGADGTFYVARAGKLYAAAGPAYKSFADTPKNFVVGQRLTEDGLAVTASWTGDLELSLPAGTPKIPAYYPESGSESSPGYAPVLLSEQDNGNFRCERVRWINEKYLLCMATSRQPVVVDVSGAKLVAAPEYAKADSCSECYGQQYLWQVPDKSVRSLVPKTQRELVGFVVAKDGQSVFFLGSGGDNQAILYSVSLKKGATPTKLGTINLAEDAAPSFSYLTLQLRA